MTKTTKQRLAKPMRRLPGRMMTSSTKRSLGAERTTRLFQQIEFATIPIGTEGEANVLSFLGDLRGQVERAVEQELVGTGWTAATCPWLDFWFSYYQGRSAAEIEAALRKYVGKRVDGPIDALVDPVVARVRRAVTHWRSTGEADAPTASAPALAPVPPLGGVPTRIENQVALETPPSVARESASGPSESVKPDELQAIATRATAGGGAPLLEAPAQKLNLFGIDPSNVRVHTGSAAAEAAEELDANAFTSGDQIFFGEGQYRPGTLDGDRLIAHELAHVAQNAIGTLDGGTRLTKPSDRVESAADAMAGTILAGNSIANHRLRTTGGLGQTVARKPNPDAKTEEESEYTLPDEVEDFAVAPDGWSALVRTRWLKVHPTERLFQMLRQMQRLGAFTWAKEADLHLAAEETEPKLEGDDVIKYIVTLHTLAIMGLPPLSAAMVAREWVTETLPDGTEVKQLKLLAAFKVAGLKKDKKEKVQEQPLGYDDTRLFENAVEKFTNLKVKNHPRLLGVVVRDGIVEVEVSDAEAAQMFGRKGWEAWKEKRDSGDPEKDDENPENKPADVSSELSFAERMHVEGWLRAHLNLVDSGPVTSIDRSTLNVIDEIDHNPDLEPYLKQLIDKRTTRPGQVAGTFDLANLLEAAKTERERHRLGTDKLAQGNTTVLDPSATVWNIGASLVQRGEVYSGRETTFKLELDWPDWWLFRSADSVDEFAKRNWHDEVEWAVERLDKPDKPYLEKQSHNESSNIKLDHTFELGPNERIGQFKVHAFLRTTHFYPMHVEVPVEVKTEQARLDELKDRDLGDMIDANTMSMNYKFDIGTGSKILSPIAGHDEDTHGYAMSGQLPMDFEHLDPAARLEGRQKELQLQQSLVDYLQLQQQAGKVGYGDAIEAANQRIKFLNETEDKLTTDEAAGWTGFEIRGTYLSRDNDVPSGALDLYGYLRVVTTEPKPRSGKAANELPPEVPVTKFEIKIHDLSNKVETDLEFDGDSVNFDDALREAFLKLAKAYPDGKVSVVAEDMVITADKHAKATGRSIGYELGTNSAWKRAKAKVWDPAVQIVTNAAAMAVMIVFPPSAAVIVPMLAVADIVSNVDDMVTKHDRGKLGFRTATIDLLSIGLDLLPFARGAKLLNPAKTAVQEAKGVANLRLVLFDAVQLGGQFVVMVERTKEQLADIQEKQISGLAEKYRKLIELQNKVAKHEINPSDPRLAQQQADIEADAKAIRDTVTTTWVQAVESHATFFVGAHLLGGGEEAEAGHAANDDTRFAPRREQVREPDEMVHEGKISYGEPIEVTVGRERHQLIVAKEPDEGPRVRMCSGSCDYVVKKLKVAKAKIEENGDDGSEAAVKAIDKLIARGDKLDEKLDGANANTRKKLRPELETYADDLVKAADKYPEVGEELKDVRPKQIFPDDKFAADPDVKKWPPKKWPPDTKGEPPPGKPKTDEPDGATWRYKRYLWEKYLELKKPAKRPEEVLSPQEWFEQHFAPKASGQSPGEAGGPKHRALVDKVKRANGLEGQVPETGGGRRPDVMGEIGKPLKVAGKPYKPEPWTKRGRVIYEADEFYADATHIKSEGRDQVRELRANYPEATIVVQDVETGNVIVYPPGTQPPYTKPGTRLGPKTDPIEIDLNYNPTKRK